MHKLARMVQTSFGGKHMLPDQQALQATTSSSPSIQKAIYCCDPKDCPSGFFFPTLAGSPAWNKLVGKNAKGLKKEGGPGCPDTLLP
jgi:hypothetical protein